jgi:hypothetical protein
MKLSNQMVGAVMMALQNSLMNQTDIQPEFEGWEVFLKDGELFVENPPQVNFEEDLDETDDILDFLTEPTE